MIHGSNKFCHITPLLWELHWLPVEFRISFKILCLAFKTLNGLAPIYLTEQITCYKPTRSLKFADKELFAIRVLARMKKRGVHGNI